MVSVEWIEFQKNNDPKEKKIQNVNENYSCKLKEREINSTMGSWDSFLIPILFLDSYSNNVHPVPPPNSEIKERIMKRYETKRIKIEKLLTLGYTTSEDPWKITTK